MTSLRTQRAAAIALVAGMVVVACSNPVAPGAHVRPAGMIIRAGADTVVHVVGTTVTGELTVQAGQQTAPLTVHFLDGAGNEITPPQGYYLNVEVQTAGVAAWTQNTPGEFAGRLQGVAAGTTTLEFQWVHGPVGGGHVDERFSIQAVVTP